MSDSAKARQLKKHKYIATGLFILMAVIYALMVYKQQVAPAGWAGYVKAFAEAGMVGALADWFAVTALFRHPLGIPIPHTNLIERKKNDLGRNLGHFVNENFLNPENIRPYINRIDIAEIITGWLEKPGNSKLLENELTNLLHKIIHDIPDREAEDFLTQKGAELLHSINFQQLAASGIAYLVKKEEPMLLLENLLPQIKTYIQDNEQIILQRLAESRPFIAFLAGKKISREITGGFVAFIEEVENDKAHFVRQKLTENLLNLEQDLRHQKWEHKFSRFKKELITPDKLNTYARDTWNHLKTTLQNQIEDPEAKLREVIRKTIEKLTADLKTDRKLSDRLNSWIRHFIYRMILKNRQEIEKLISSTIAGWEAKELSEKLELEVGKDLQFIRVNGTLVGGLMGLLIYIITHLLTG